MAKKAEVQKKDEHENRNAVIVGFLIALLPLIILILVGWSSTGFTSISDICRPGCTAQQIQEYNQEVQEAIRTNSTTYPNTPCLATGLCSFRVLLYGVLPMLFLLYLSFGVILYSISLNCDTEKSAAEHGFKLRFLAKSLLPGERLELCLER